MHLPPKSTQTGRPLKLRLGSLLTLLLLAGGAVILVVRRSEVGQHRRSAGAPSTAVGALEGPVIGAPQQVLADVQAPGGVEGAERAPISVSGSEPARADRPAANTLVGRLVAGADRPLSGVRVIGQLYGHGTRITTDEVGLFAFEGLPDRGEFVLTARDPEHGVWTTRVRLTPPFRTIHLGTVRLEPAGLLEGRVVGPDGVGVPGLPMLLQPLMTESHLLESGVSGVDVTASFTDMESVGLHRASGEDGSFRFADLDRATEYRVSYGKLPVAMNSVTLALPQVGLVLESRAAGVRIQFVDRSGEPVSELEIHAEPMGPRAGVIHWFERIHSGTCSLWARSSDASASAPAELRVVGHARRGERMLVGQAEVQVGAGIPSLEVILDEVLSLPISWELLDPSGKAVRAFRLRVFDASTGVALPFLTDRGQPVDRFLPGRFRVDVRPEAASFALPFICDVTVSSSASRHVVLRASEWGGALEVQSSSNPRSTGMERLSVVTGGHVSAAGVYTSYLHQPIDEALPVGSHLLEVRSLVNRAPSPPAQVWPFEIRRGELTKVDLSSGVLE